MKELLLKIITEWRLQLVERLKTEGYVINFSANGYLGKSKYDVYNKNTKSLALLQAPTDEMSLKVIGAHLDNIMTINSHFNQISIKGHTVKFVFIPEEEDAAILGYDPIIHALTIDELGLMNEEGEWNLWAYSEGQHGGWRQVGDKHSVLIIKKLINVNQIFCLK